MTKKKINTHLQAAWLLRKHGYKIKPVRGEKDFTPTSIFRIIRIGHKNSDGELITMLTLMGFAKHINEEKEQALEKHAEE